MLDEFIANMFASSELEFSSFLIPAAVFMQTVAIYCIYSAWQAPSTQTRRKLIGCLLLALSLGVLSFPLGVEYGISIGLLSAGLVAWFLIYYQNRDCNSSEVSAKEKVRKTVDFDGKGAAVITLQTLLFIPVFCLSSVGISLAIGYSLPFTEANQFATATLLLPFVWGLQIFYSLTASSKIRVALTLLCLSLLSSLKIYTL